jgi:hypothetical protein
MTIDINAAMEAGSKRQPVRKWIDKLPADFRESLIELRDQYTARNEAGGHLNTLQVASNICEQLTANGHSPPTTRTVEKWLKYRD